MPISYKGLILLTTPKGKEMLFILAYLAIAIAALTITSFIFIKRDKVFCHSRDA
jgi:hypothetical protein